MPAKAPYNFVPAPEWNEVFKPEWAEQVSHDLPFSDGESAEIEIEIEAETPIFIRSGKEPKGEIQHFPSFMQDGEKKYYIPGSSIKGMVRNVLEIMSRSMLNPEFVADDRFSFRNLYDPLYKEIFNTYNLKKAGWLYVDSLTGDWLIEECEFCKIHHRYLKFNNGVSFEQLFSDRSYDKKYRNAYKKYSDIDEKYLEINFDEKITHYGVEAYNIHEGKRVGKLVMTGQASYRNEQTQKGKVHEFLFYSKQKNNNTILISKQDKRDFLHIYGDADEKAENSWKYWKKTLKKGERVPVFYLVSKETGEFIYFGLASMFKFPYEHRIHDLSPISTYPQKNKDIDRAKDLAVTIFGHVNSNYNSKGRVSFSHAICHHKVDYPSDVPLVLSSPRASYFPHYLSNDTTNVSLYNEAASTLKGFKRYFIREKEVTQAIGDGNDNETMITTFRPLGTGSRFRSVLRFHNLRKVEIGALLSAITFHKNDSIAKHQIGGAKSYGFGKIRISIVRTSLKQNGEIDSYMKAFERKMYEDNHNIGDWMNGKSINSLLSIGSGKNQNPQILTYPTLEEYNRRDSSLDTPKLPNNIYINRYYRYFDEEIKKENRIQEIKRLLESNDYVKISEYINNHPTDPEIKELNEKIRKLFIDNIEKYYEGSDINSLENLKRLCKDDSLILKIEKSIYEIRKKNAQNKQKQYENTIIPSNPIDFDQLKKVPNSIRSKYKDYVFTPEQKAVIIDGLERLLNQKNTQFFQSGRFISFGKYPWTDVIKWLGEDEAKKIYQKQVK